MAREIRTRYLDSVCVRCGRDVEQYERVMWSKPIGVWCVERCIPEFPEPSGDLRLAVGVLERLESEGRLNGYTTGILERYRVTGRMSIGHQESILPQDTERRWVLEHSPARPPRTIEDLGPREGEA